MITTFFGQDGLGSGTAFLLSLLLGFGFGFALEQAGFGSSRRLAGIFYLRDMTVLQVMFTAMVTAMLGLQAALALGVVSAEQLYFLPTVYGAQFVGGLLFGVGFVLSSWCPGTAAVGLASGRLDALVFLVGAALGSVLFNEFYPIVSPLTSWGDSGVSFIWAALRISGPAFALILSAVAVAAFWGSEWIERRVAGAGPYLGSPFLKAFSVTILVAALAVALLPPLDSSPVAQASAVESTEVGLLQAMEAGEDHVDPDELAERLLTGDPALLLIDIRTPGEFAAFHIPGAMNVSAADLPEFLAPHKNSGTIVLYSNGMTHAAQARDALARMGFANAYLLTDGLQGFIEQVLKPASLRRTPVSEAQATKINAWRTFFLGGAQTPSATPATAPGDAVRLVETSWLGNNLGRDDLRIIDLRPQPAYNGGHIPGSVRMDVEHFRGVIGGVSSMLLPTDMITRRLGLLGVTPQMAVILVPTDKLHDATLVALALERAGHNRCAILDGGWEQWVAEQRPTDTLLPAIVATDYPMPSGADRFTVDYRTVLAHSRNRTAIILDVRPPDFFSGMKSDEARAGHVPGAINRPFTLDVSTNGIVTRFRPVSELAEAYAKLIPSKDSPVVVMCRTGHQASHSYFVLRHLLGYARVSWYDGGWSEWASRPELPIESAF